MIEGYRPFNFPSSSHVDTESRGTCGENDHIYEIIQGIEWIKEIFNMIFWTTVTLGSAWTLYEDVREGKRRVTLLDPKTDKLGYVQQVNDIFRKLDENLVAPNSVERVKQLDLQYFTDSELTAFICSTSRFQGQGSTSFLYHSNLEHFTVERLNGLLEQVDASVAQALLRQLSERKLQELLPKISIDLILKVPQEKIQKIDLSLMSWDEIRVLIVKLGECVQYEQFLTGLSEKQIVDLLKKLNDASEKDREDIVSEGLKRVFDPNKIDMLSKQALGNPIEDFRERLGRFIGKNLEGYSLSDMQKAMRLWYRSNHPDSLSEGATDKEKETSTVRAQEMNELKEELDQLMRE